jgi:phosphoenolpyruvate carboxykinase (GTP)
MGDYFGHWLDVGTQTDAEKLPRIFYVNWFRKGADGKFLWPGYGHNSRVLAWVHDRVSGHGAAVDTQIGRLPAPGSIYTAGVDVSAAALDELLAVDVEAWRAEIPLIEEHFAQFGDRLPAALHEQLDQLGKRLSE